MLIGSAFTLFGSFSTLFGSSTPLFGWSMCKKSKWWKAHKNEKSIQDYMWKRSCDEMYVFGAKNAIQCLIYRKDCYLLSLMLDLAMFAFVSPHLKAKHFQSDILFDIEKTYIVQAKVQGLIKFFSKMQLLVFQNWFKTVSNFHNFYLHV